MLTEQRCAICGVPWVLGHRCKPTCSGEVSAAFRVSVPLGIVREYDARELRQQPQARITRAGQYDVTAEELSELIADSAYQGNVDGHGIEDSPPATKAMYRRFLAHLREAVAHG